MSPRESESPTFGAMLGELVDLTAGLGVLLLPLLATALPGVILFVLLPALLLVGALVAPLLLAGALAAPYLIVRTVRQRRRDAGQ